MIEFRPYVSEPTNLTIDPYITHCRDISPMNARKAFTMQDIELLIR